MSSKANAGNFFEDFELNEEIIHATPRTITEGDVSLYIALTGSRFLLQSSAEAAKTFGFNDLIVDNLLAFHIAFGKTVADISLNAIANLGYADVRFEEPVYIGDTLSVTSKVIGLRENKNKKSGIVYVHSMAMNQDHITVLSWKRWVMVKKSDLNAEISADYIPELSEFVSIDELPIPQQLNMEEFDPYSSGSPYLWDDFEIGERIDHRDGMTIDDSDHTLATKLYQNTARVHFDQIYMNDSKFKRRLMYGGHVISICRALSYNGLGNGLLIAAINGGTHAAPTFGGDTIYAFSSIVDRWQLPEHEDFGALRVKTWGVKNTPSETIDKPTSIQDGRKTFHKDIVLELDYTLLVPRWHTA